MRAAVLACCAAGGLAGCASGTSGSQSTSLPDRTVPAPASTAAAGDPQVLARQAYLGMWQAFTAASRTADYQSPSLDRCAAGAALTLLIQGLYHNYRAGIVVLAALAGQTLGLPSPVIRSSPAQAALQLTNLPTWLWVSPAEWVPESKTATVQGESVTATATPVSVTWHPGDGSTVTCQGAGTPYTSADNPASASPDCGHTYNSSSAGQPGGAFQATATITWDVAWQGAGGAGGVLPPLFTTAVAAFRVAESQALNTSGGT